jgi:DNA-directed RNA polymerase specialized sigma24 family protein
MSDSGASPRHREPDSAEFQRLLLRLGPDRVEAWEAFDRLRRKLARFFDWHACEDAEELAWQVLDRIAMRPDLEQIRSVPEFAIGVARNVCKESRAKEQRISYVEDLAAGTESLVDPRSCVEDIADTIDQAARSDCLQTALARLSERDRTLAVEYYSAEGVKQHVKRRLLALRFGFTGNALRVHMNRLREKLERDVMQCLTNSRRTKARIKC